MLAFLMRLMLRFLGANIALVSITLFTGQRLDTTVDLYVYVQQLGVQRLVLEEPYRAIRLDFDAPPCLDPFFSQSDEQNFESRTNFYAWSATRIFTLPAAEALAILECRWQAHEARLVSPAIEAEIGFT